MVDDSDALELRELRLKMKQKGEAREAVDGELICPGWVRELDGREENCASRWTGAPPRPGVQPERVAMKAAGEAVSPSRRSRSLH